jgi:hypothetical protein
LAAASRSRRLEAAVESCARGRPACESVLYNAAMRSHLHPADLRALSRLGIDAVTGITHLVESLHHAVGRVAPPLGRAPAGRTRGITGLVYRSVHGVTRTVGGGLDLALDLLLPWLVRRAGAPPKASAEREAVLAALNGVLGDHLADTGNSLAIPMQLRRFGRPLTLRADAIAARVPAPRSRLLLRVHGLCMNDRQWSQRARRAVAQSIAAHATNATASPAAAPRTAADPWLALADQLGCTLLDLHYNTGRHVSSNGRELCALLDQLVQHWPRPVTDIVIVGHSMGGLVARSACAAAAGAAGGWLPRLRALVFLGTPHHGAPLERGGSWVDLLLGASPYSAPFARLGQLRSAGITDLRHGNVSEADGQGRSRFARGDARVPLPLPAGVRCFALAASTGRQAGDLGDRVLGDGLVPVASALGRHADPAHTLAFAPAHCAVLYGRGHLDLISDGAVLAQVRQWLAPLAAEAASGVAPSSPAVPAADPPAPGAPPR